VRPNPYWHRIGEKGCCLGYRRVTGGFGFWLARCGSLKRIQEKLGTADDVLDAVVLDRLMVKMRNGCDRWRTS
jgi:hypothetical protein